MWEFLFYHVIKQMGRQLLNKKRTVIQGPRTPRVANIRTVFLSRITLFGFFFTQTKYDCFSFC